MEISMDFQIPRNILLKRPFFEFDCADPRAADTKPTPHPPALWTTFGSRLADAQTSALAHDLLRARVPLLELTAQRAKEIEFNSTTSF
jgi:hypothetical protein